MQPTQFRTRNGPMPRPIRPDEVAVIRRLLQVGADSPVPAALLASVAGLVVHSACDCGCDSLLFASDRCLGEPIAIGVARMRSGAHVELWLWVHEGSITYLELEPLVRKPARLPPVDAIGPFPEDGHLMDWT
jgi:hypothetical protein